MRLSLIGIARPSARSVASSSAQRRPVATTHGMHCNLEPALQSAPATTTREQQDAETDLPQDDRIDSQVRLIVPEPLDNTLVWGRLGRLREDVRVNQEARHTIS